MESINKHKLKTAIFWIVGILLTCLPLALYFYVFGRTSNYVLSDSHQTWSDFGSYLGGTIGPILSGIAFLGIWKTYLLQNKQLQQANNQRKSEDVQRLIFIVAERIDFRLNKQVDILSTLNGSNNTGSCFDLETAIAFIRGITTQLEHKLESEAPKLIQYISLDLTQLKIDAENLSWLLKNQASIFNETTLTDFYYYRYRPILKTMLQIGINLLPITLEVFGLNQEMTAE